MGGSESKDKILKQFVPIPDIIKIICGYERNLPYLKEIENRVRIKYENRLYSTYIYSYELQRQCWITIKSINFDYSENKHMSESQISKLEGTILHIRHNEMRRMMIESCMYRHGEDYILAEIFY